MNVLIVGCNESGCFLARKLEDLHQDVSVLDNDPKRLEKLNAFGHTPFNGVAISGVTIDVDVLRAAGIEDCDAVLAVTEDDNVNIMVSEVATQVFKVKKVLACINDPILKEIYQEQFGVVSVSPTAVMASMLINIILEDKQPYVVPVGRTLLDFKTLKINPKLTGEKLSSLPQPKDSGLLVGLLHANGSMSFANEPNLTIVADDMFVIAAMHI
ncbi:MAG: NAD-binding protein [Oscillospiraceae bacterium]